MKRIIIISLFVVIAGCSQTQSNLTNAKLKNTEVDSAETIEQKSGPGGMTYRVLVDKPGKNIEEGDFVIYDMVSRTEKDSVYQSSYFEQSVAFANVNSPFYPGDVNDRFKLLSEGDSAVFKIKNAEISQIDSVGNELPPLGENIKGDFFTSEIKIHKVIPKSFGFDRAYNEYKKYRVLDDKRFKLSEDRYIEEYVKKNQKIVSVPSGLSYEIMKKGDGANILIGDTVTFNLTATLLSGKIFYTNDRNLAKQVNPYTDFEECKPITAIVKANQTPLGLYQALTLMSRGSKARFIVPSKLAYGNKPIGDSHGYAPIIYLVEILNISRKMR